MTILAYILIACFLGTVLSIALAALVAFRVKARWISTLVSYAVGALLGAAFLDILPHLFEETNAIRRAPRPSSSSASSHSSCSRSCCCGATIITTATRSRPRPRSRDAPRGHDHGRTGWMIIFGDSFHNFTDGVIIAGAFLADVKLGVVTSLAIIAHEIPQEIGDFVVLLHSGFSKRRALLWNLISGMAAVLGALIAYFALSAVSDWIPDILAFAAASMIYVAVADLIPGLHKTTAVEGLAGAGRLHRPGHRQHLAHPRGIISGSVDLTPRISRPPHGPKRAPSPDADNLRRAAARGARQVRPPRWAARGPRSR